MLRAMTVTGGSATISGTCDPAFATVRDTFHASFTDLGDVGAAVCVMVGGRPVVDLWGGSHDVAGTRPWARDDIVCFFSCTKALAATCLHRLVDRGLVDYDAPVCRYWPGFEAAGKDGVTVRHVLTHQAGLPRLREPLGPGGLFDFALVCRALAAEAPLWEPGTAHGYHTLSFGHLVGEIVRRVDGRPLGTYLADEIAGPCEADVVVGVPPGDDGRVVDHLLPPLDTQMGPTAAAAVGRDPMTVERIDDPATLTPPIVNSIPWRRATIPGGNGHGNARGLARVYAAIVDGRLLSADTLAAATTSQVFGPDLTIGLETHFGLGYGLPGGYLRLGPSPTAFGHGGAYGSLGMGDPAAGLAFGYVLNQGRAPIGDPRASALVEAAYRCL
jgi:CubicO group peptidase (beta-lactamase class C family)